MVSRAWTSSTDTLLLWLNQEMNRYSNKRIQCAILLMLIVARKGIKSMTRRISGNLTGHHFNLIGQTHHLVRLCLQL